MSRRQMIHGIRQAVPLSQLAQIGGLDLSIAPIGIPPLFGFFRGPQPVSDTADLVAFPGHQSGQMPADIPLAAGNPNRGHDISLR